MQEHSVLKFRTLGKASGPGSLRSFISTCPFLGKANSKDQVHVDGRGPGRHCGAGFERNDRLRPTDLRGCTTKSSSGA